MNKKLHTREQKRFRRRARVRARIVGTAVRPRLSVFRSLRGMYVQLIDDASQTTLASAHSKTVAPAPNAGERTGKVAIAYALGLEIAKQAAQANITTVVFDRGGYAYHGRVQAVADGAREGGLTF